MSRQEFWTDIYRLKWWAFSNPRAVFLNIWVPEAKTPPSTFYFSRRSPDRPLYNNHTVFYSRVLISSVVFESHYFESPDTAVQISILSKILDQLHLCCPSEEWDVVLENRKWMTQERYQMVSHCPQILVKSENGKKNKINKNVYVHMAFKLSTLQCCLVIRLRLFI